MRKPALPARQSTLFLVDSPASGPCETNRPSAGCCRFLFGYRRIDSDPDAMHCCSLLIPLIRSIFTDVDRLFQNTNSAPQNGSAFSFCLQTRASPSMPHLKSAGSTATHMRVCAVTAIMRGHPRMSGLTPSDLLRLPSTRFAFESHGHFPSPQCSSKLLPLVESPPRT